MPCHCRLREITDTAQHNRIADFIWCIDDLVLDHTELFKQYADNASFKRWFSDRIFNATYQPPAAGAP